MTDPQNPFSVPNERDMDPADLWEKKVDEGMSIDEATSYVKAHKGSKIMGVGRSAAQGATFGFSDELAGIGAAIIPGGRGYSEARDASRAKLKGFRQAHPVLSTVGEIGGGLATGLAGGGRALARTGAAQAYRALSPTARAVSAGIAGGAAYGAGTAEGDLQDRARGAAVGGAVGGVAGAALPAIAGVVKKPVSAALDVTGLRPATRTGAARFLPITSVDERANEILMKRMAKDGLQVDDAIRSVAGRADDNPMTVMDMGGRNTRRLGRTVRTIPDTKASNSIEQAVMGRGESQPSRIGDALSRGLGAADENVTDLAESIIQRRSQEAAPLYDKVMNEIVPDPRVDQILGRGGSMERAVKRAQQLAVDAGEQFPGPEDPMTVRGLHYVKMALDDMLDVGKRGGESGMGAHQRRAITNVKNDLLQLLDDSSPGYAEARSVFRGHSELADALEQGRSFVRSSGDDVAGVLQGMADDQKDLYRIGALRSLKEQLERSTDGTNGVRRIFGNQAIRDKLKLLFPDDEAYETFARRMADETEMVRTKNTVMGGSPTADKQAEVMDFGLDAISGAGQAVRGITSPLSTLGDMAFRKLLGGRRGVKRTAEALGPKLTAGMGGRDEILDLLRILQEQAKKPRLRGAGVAGNAAVGNN